MLGMCLAPPDSCRHGQTLSGMHLQQQQHVRTTHAAAEHSRTSEHLLLDYPAAMPESSGAGCHAQQASRCHQHHLLRLAAARLAPAISSAAVHAHEGERQSTIRQPHPSLGPTCHEHHLPPAAAACRAAAGSAHPSFRCQQSHHSAFLVLQSQRGMPVSPAAC